VSLKSKRKKAMYPEEALRALSISWTIAELVDGREHQLLLSGPKKNNG
jgi:hypothetical protein